MYWRSYGGALVALTMVVSHAVGQANTDEVRGSRVTVELASRRRAVLRGELIAVSADSLWLLNDSGIVGARLGYVSGASLKRHSMNGRTGLVWTVVGGLVTGGLLTAACSSVSEDCGGVFVGTMLAWGIVGGSSALSMEMSSRSTFRAPNIGEKLRGYARFPQGLPRGIDRSDLAVRLRVQVRVPLP